jgi:hypothetical protein
MTFFHGTRNDAFTAHVGLCLTTDEDAARRYGRNGLIVELEIDRSALRILSVDVSREDIDANNWPGDTAASAAAIVADGYDAVTYTDMDCDGNTHPTLRLLTPAAVDTITMVSVDEV